jgi:hypothetical protein
MHRLSEGWAGRGQQWDGTTVVGGLAPTLSEKTGSGGICVDECDKRGPERGQFLSKHGVAAGEGVNEHPSEWTALSDGVALPEGKGQVEGASLLVPEGLGRNCAVIGLGADRAAGEVPVAGWVIGRAHGEMKIVDPRGDVYWI